jgi:hypothetical protein
MKKLILTLMLAQPLITHAEIAEALSNFIDLPGGKVAAVAWDTKDCINVASSTEGGGEICSTPEGNTFYAPTALIFNKTGQLEKTIPFFDNLCAYNPVKLSRSGQRLTLTAQVIGSLFEGGNNQYPDCQYANGTTFKESRSLKTGAPLNRITLQDYRTATLP